MITSPRPVTPAGILARRLESLVELASHLPEQDPLRTGVAEAHALAAGLDPYLSRWSTPASPALDALEERTRAFDWNEGGLEQEMLSGSVEGQFLKMLVHATQARSVLEIGMFTGYSALAMAEALPVGGSVVACELSPTAASFARESLSTSRDGEKIDIRVGPAQETLAGLADEGRQFDLVFLDADKAGYHGYLETLIGRGLTTPRALICVDNTLMQGEPWTGVSTPNGAAIAAFNEAVADDPRVEQVLVPLRDGVTLIRVVEA